MARQYVFTTWRYHEVTGKSRYYKCKEFILIIEIQITIAFDLIPHYAIS